MAYFSRLVSRWSPLIATSTSIFVLRSSLATTTTNNTPITINLDDDVDLDRNVNNRYNNPTHNVTRPLAFKNYQNRYSKPKDDITKLCNYINGKLVEPASGNYIDNINPATNKLNNLIPDSDYRDVEKAVKSAKEAHKTWSKLHFSERAVYLDKIAVALEEALTFNEIAIAETNDMGKPISDMKNDDLPESIEQFKMYSRFIQSFTTPYYQMKDAIAFEHRDSIGLVGIISPWNYPLLEFCIKFAVAIVCGNCVICKPSELSPTTAYLLSKVCIDVGLPPGVVNIIHGYGSKAGESIVKHKDIRAISFTGGSATGSRISSIAGPQLKKLQLELGGKNPAIVFNDCYLDETIEGVAVSEFLNTGQVCCSCSRVLVQKEIAPKFIEKMAEHINNVWIPSIGNPLSENTKLGPLVSKTHFKKVESYLELAQQEGGTVICGGKYGKDISCRLSDEFSDGNWFEPCLITDLDDTSRCAMEEIFGPIMTIHIFDTEEDAIRIANQVDYGLAASIWTSDIRRGQRVAREIEAGSVWINCYLYQDCRMPFGGFKNSGVGREYGLHSIDFFTEIKSIVSKL